MSNLKGIMDISTLYTNVSICPTLPKSLTALFDGLLVILDAEDNHSDLTTSLRALTVHPDDENQQISWVALLGQALTRNTSHVNVRQNDALVEVVRSALEMKPRAKAARVASILLAVEQPALDQIEKVLGAHLDTLTSVVTEIDAKTDKLVALQAGAEASLEDLDRVTTLAKALAAAQDAHAAEVAAHEATKAELAKAVPS